MILKSSSREVQQTTRRRPKASIPRGNEAAFARVRIVDGACAWVLEDRGSVSEIDPVSSQIGTSFLGVPLEGHELSVCTIVHTRKRGARFAIKRAASRGRSSIWTQWMDALTDPVAPGFSASLLGAPGTKAGSVSRSG